MILPIEPVWNKPNSVEVSSEPVPDFAAHDDDEASSCQGTNERPSPGKETLSIVNGFTPTLMAYALSAITCETTIPSNVPSHGRRTIRAPVVCISMAVVVSSASLVVRRQMMTRIVPNADIPKSAVIQ